MTQLHFTLNIEDIHNLINSEVKNDIARNILTKVFNELMEKERDGKFSTEVFVDTKEMKKI